MRKLKETGNCFQDSANKILDAGPMSGFQLVHGLPMGQGGDAKLAGRYPHAWIEHQDQVWDPLMDDWYPKDFYYRSGQIEHTVRYNRPEVRDNLISKGNYGPWDKIAIERGKEIDKIRV